MLLYNDAVCSSMQCVLLLRECPMKPLLRAGWRCECVVCVPYEAVTEGQVLLRVLLCECPMKPLLRVGCRCACAAV
jgi:hypothetical protein